jgi:hypothetical protein
MSNTSYTLLGRFFPSPSPMPKDLGPRPKTLAKIRVNGRNYSVQVQFEEHGTHASVKVGGSLISGRIIPSGSDTLATESLLKQVQALYPDATPVYC